MKRRLRSAVSSAVDTRAAPVVPVARTASAAVLAALFTVSAPVAVALEEAARQPLDSISERAVALLRARHEDDPTLRIGGGELDARLRLRRCTAPLDASIAPGSGDVGLVTVQVRCPVLSGWRVHVRLDVSRERVLWTFARSARRGEVLGPDLVARTTVSLGRAESRLARAGVPIETLEPWLGHELVRDVDAGRPLVADVLAPRRLVTRGADVRLRVGGAGLAIETVGEALADAALDERVPVRNRASGRVVEAIVTGRDRVEIRPAP